jgi:hypothetical protein
MKLPKAKCEKCKHCSYISMYNDIHCEVLNKKYGTFRKPKRCLNFKKGVIPNDR